MSLHLFVSTLLIALAASLAHAKDRGDVLLFAANIHGKRIDYSVSEDRAKKLPPWNPRKPSIPLPVHKAVEKAEAWLKIKNPKTDSFEPRRIDLGSVAYGQHLGLWYYMVHFDTVEGGKPQQESGTHAVVLMDGSIVEPTP
jgi:hypothetical protein